MPLPMPPACRQYAHDDDSLHRPGSITARLGHASTSSPHAYASAGSGYAAYTSGYTPMPAGHYTTDYAATTWVGDKWGGGGVGAGGGGGGGRGGRGGGGGEPSNVGEAT